MPNRHAPPVPIPELGKKLRLLFMLSKIRSYESLGCMFASSEWPNGLTENSVRNWVKGPGARAPESVPAARFDSFVKIVRSQLPGSRSEAETAALLVNGSAAEFQAAFISSESGGWFAEVLLEAPAGAAMLVPAAPADTLRLTTRQKAPGEPPEDEAKPHPIQDPFRIEYVAADRGWILAIQCGRTGFFSLDLKDGRATWEIPAGKTTLPLDGRCYRESEPSRKRYLFLLAPAPLPPDLKHALDASAKAKVPVDIGHLDRIAQLSTSMEKASWSSLDISFYDGSLIQR